MSDSMWLLWLAGALLAAILEVTSLNLVFAMFSLGAVAAAVAAGIGAPVTVQTLVFALASTLLLLVARPVGLRMLRRSTPAVATGTAGLVGRTAAVLEEVTEHGGQVKLAGEVWTARASGPTVPLPVGSQVTVVAIDGATAVIRPESPPRYGHPVTGGSARPQLQDPVPQPPQQPEPGPAQERRD
jgi:membrane protein implicated in regulation of membrane protease activity